MVGSGGSSSCSELPLPRLLLDDRQSAVGQIEGQVQLFGLGAQR